MAIVMTMTFDEYDGLTMVIMMTQVDDKGINNGNYNDGNGNGDDKDNDNDDFNDKVMTQVGAMDELCLHFSTLHNQAEKRTCVLRSRYCHY